jgi:putative ABC transport system permease protein
VYTYVRLVPGASVERLQASMQSLVQSLWVKRPPGLGASVTLVRLDRVHLFPGFNPGAHGRLLVSLAAGLVILFVAGINFVNLSTARASRRAREVMVRKVAGASRGALILQFLGESFVYVVLATSMALALTELLLPSVNAFVKGGATFDVVSDPVLIAWIGCGVVLLSVVAGLYPAFVLSSFRPVGVLRGLPVSSRGAGLTRQVLVTLQFAVLISLIVCATVMYQQREFATSDALRASTDQHLIIRSECREALKNELKELAGVRSVGCATPSFVTSDSFANVRLFDGTETAVGVASIDAGMLEQYGLVPVAGRFFSAEDSGAAANVLINEAAVRRYRFASPQAAIGQSLPEAGPSAQVTRVIGVVPDFSLHSVEREIPPTVYYGAGRSGPFRSLIDVKLTGERIPETLTAIQRVWKSAGESQPPQLLFLDDYIQGLYQTMLQFAQAFAVMSALAVVLACLGLVGLSVSTTERRRKEIGIRKAMGASVSNVLRLLAWQFTKPVLWAMLIAWPVSAGLMHRWLEGFAYHVPLTPWPFLAAGALALGVAWVTVSVQSYSVARSPPTRALRYE